MSKPQPNRREMLEIAISRGILAAGLSTVSQTRLLAFWQNAEETAHIATKGDVLGPFFRKGAPATPNLRGAGDPGFPLKVAGRVLDTGGRTIEGVKVDLWHADHSGRYDTRGYKYRAKIAPDAKGGYLVETVMPGHYADRPAQHIHYMITAPGHKTLITQAYFATDPFYEGNPDKTWAKNGIAGHRELILPVKLFEGGVGPKASPAHAEISFDLILEKA